MHIFKDDTDIDLARVMKINKWEHLQQQCMCMTPRRFGVSTATTFSNCNTYTNFIKLFRKR